MNLSRINFVLYDTVSLKSMNGIAKFMGRLCSVYFARQLCPTISDQYNGQRL